MLDFDVETAEIAERVELSGKLEGPLQKKKKKYYSKNHFVSLWVHIKLTESGR